MKIKVKNVKINEAFSEETLMFMADVYIDSKKVAYARNDGHGGSTFCHAYEGQKLLLEKAEVYAKTLGLRFTKAKDGFDCKWDLEGVIDDLVYAISEKKPMKSKNPEIVNVVEIVNGILTSVESIVINTTN